VYYVKSQEACSQDERLLVYVDDHMTFTVLSCSHAKFYAYKKNMPKRLMIESGIHLRICSCPTGTFLDRYLSLWFLSGSPVSDELQSFWYMSVLLSDRALTKASVVER